MLSILAGCGLSAACSSDANKGKDAGSTADLAGQNGHLDASASDGSVDAAGLDASSTDSAASTDDAGSGNDASVDDLGMGDDLRVSDDLALLDGATPDLPPDMRVVLTGCNPPAPYTRLSPATYSLPSDGLALWIRADVGLSLDSNAGVCAADDQSGLEHSFVQPTASSRGHATGAIGSQTAIAMSPGQDLERDGVLDIPGASARTFIVVAQLVDTASRTWFFQQGLPSSPGTYIGIEANTFNGAGGKLGLYFQNNSYDSQIDTSTSPIITVERVDSMAVTEPTAVLTRLDGRVNAVAQTLTRNSGGLGNGNIEDFSAANHSWLGVGGGTYQIAEVLVWSRRLSDTEVVAVESYLATRYGIELPLE